MEASILGVELRTVCLLAALLVAVCPATVQAGPEISLHTILDGIAVVESGGRDIGRHGDGVSFGRYGVTQMAVDELHRVGRLQTNQVDLRNPTVNRRVAGLYLTYLKDRHGSWWRAVQQYNPGSRTYAKRVWAAMDTLSNRDSGPQLSAVTSQSTVVAQRPAW